MHTHDNDDAHTDPHTDHPAANHEPAMVEAAREEETARPDPVYAAVLFLLEQARMHNRDIGRETGRHARAISEYFGASEPEPEKNYNNPNPSRRFKRSR